MSMWMYVCIAVFVWYKVSYIYNPFSQIHFCISLIMHFCNIILMFIQSSTMVDLIRHRVQLPTGYVGMVQVIPRLSSSNERHIGIRGRERLV